MARNLSETEYSKAVVLMRHTGVDTNTYAQYLRWGSVAKPLNTIFFIALNWSFWYVVFYLIGGHGLACAIFGSASVWALGVRTFNYEGHGKGDDKRKAGDDFSQDDKSINQLWPGFVAGEWHNNHHLFPNSARSGFKAYQVDLAWYYIKFMHTIGGVKSYRDSKKQFFEEYYHPFVNAKVKAS